MTRSFAQIRPWLNAGLLALALAGCASVPPPTAELSAARQAVNRADGADASQYSPAALEAARQALTRAQAAMSSGDKAQARTLALAAAADADLAYAESRAQVTQQEYRQRRREVEELRQRLQVDDGPLTPELPEIGAPDLAVGGEALRLQRLDADPELADRAPYERVRARQALAALLEARRKEQQAAQYIAVRRIAAAELAARAEQMRGHVERLERDRADLLVEASRQEAERARREAERLRVQAQIQAEEAERLRAEAEAAAQAREQAENMVIDLGGAEARRLRAERARAAELARQEAELLRQEQDEDGDGGGDDSPR